MKNKILPEALDQVALEIYGGCNYKCVMCPQGEGMGRESEFLKKIPFPVFRKTVDEAHEMGARCVSIHGSGEATLHPEMVRFVQYVKSKGMECITVSNGFRLDERLSSQLIDAGIDMVRVSGIGYDAPTYLHWMKKDAFDLARNNARRFAELCREKGSHSKLRLYHLILDQTQVEMEVEQYRRNWVDFVEAEAEIWMMHNWSGIYHVDNPRSASKRRSCGRPFSPYLNVRAGGLNGRHGAVVPCCYVLGRDSEAVLGHLDEQNIDEIWNSSAYQDLRDKHIKGEFDDIPYCKDCDQLYDVPEALVWTNIPGKKYGQSKYIKELDYRKWA